MVARRRVPHTAQHARRETQIQNHKDEIDPRHLRMIG
jgi:hypothetical protein